MKIDLDQNEPSTSSTSNSNSMNVSTQSQPKEVKIVPRGLSAAVVPKPIKIRSTDPRNFASDPDLLINSITAMSYSVYDCNEKKMLVTKKANLKREVASLTKMMTLFCVMRLLVRFQLSPKQV